MKFIRNLVAVAALSAYNVVSASPLPVSESVDQTAPVFGRAVCRPISKPKGRLFNINGKTQYFASTNAWWLGHLRENSEVDQALSQIAETGYKVVRTWGFGNTNDAATTTDVYYQVLNSTGQYFNFEPSNGIPRLDYVVSAAEKYGLQLVLPLNNNYDNLGGFDTYARAFGTDHNGFYTNTAAQDAYKKYIKLIVNRYKQSCSIFAWELANEPRCSGCDTSVVYNWAKDISAYIKSLDSKHMVTLGDEGWLVPPYGDGSYAYSGYEGVDFAKNLEIPTLDYGTFHLYPEYWGYNYTWGNTWIKQHNAIGKALNKPVFLEEYGVSNSNFREGVEFEWQDTVKTKTSVASDAFWQFGTRFASGTNPFDGFAVYYGSDEYEVLATEHVADVNDRRAKSDL